MGNEVLIGEKLRQARLTKNIGLDELQQKSKIQKRYLEAIERGQFECLPGDYYIRSFIRQYAAVVGEDGDYLVAVFDGKKSLGPSPAKRPEPEVVKGSRTALHDSKSQHNKVFGLVSMGVLALVALTILAIVGYMSWQDRHATPFITDTTAVSVDKSNVPESTTPLTSSSETQETTATTSSEAPKMEVSLSDSTATSATVTLKNATDPIQLSFTAKEGRCWVGVMPNGATDFVYQKTFEPDTEDSYTLPEDTTSFLISLGASAYIEIKANGTKLDFSDPNYQDLQKKLNVVVTYAE